MTIPGWDFGDWDQPFEFGPGAVERVGAVVDGLGRSRPLVLCSAGRRESREVEMLLAGLDSSPEEVFDGVRSHVPREVAEAAWRAVHARGADAVVSLGGGAAIDLGKALVYAAGYGFEAFDDGPPEIEKAPDLAHVAVPTTYSGAEATHGFGMSEEGSKRGRAAPFTRPDAVVADPVLTLDLPAGPTAATGMNALAHCVEALYSPTRTDATDSLGERAAGELFRKLPLAVREPSDLEVRTALLAAAYAAGAVLDRAGMGVHHGLCQVLGGRTGIAHGVANAIVLPYAMRFNLDATRDGQERFARAIGASSPEQAAGMVERLVLDLGLPGRLRDAGVPREALAEVARTAAETNPNVARNPKPVSTDDALAILEAAW